MKGVWLLDFGGFAAAAGLSDGFVNSAAGIPDIPCSFTSRVARFRSSFASFLSDFLGSLASGVARFAGRFPGRLPGFTSGFPGLAGVAMNASGTGQQA